MLRSRTAAISSACAIAFIGYVCLGCGTSRPTAALNVTRLFRDAIPSPPAPVGRPASSDQETLDAIAGSSSHESLEIAAAHARLAEKAQSKSDPECVSLYAKAALES